MARRTGFAIAFLDVISSAMGATAILAVIFSVIKNPVPIPRQGEFILLRVAYRAVDGSSTGPPTVGMYVEGPGDLWWSEALGQERDDAPQGASTVTIRAWSGVETADSGGSDKMGVAVVRVTDPPAGSWYFRLYMSDFAANLQGIELVEAACWTRSGPQGCEVENEELERPARQTQRRANIIKIDVGG